MPYLRELSSSQLERGLISQEDIDRVGNFRELVKDGHVPDAHTSLSRPTESELLSSDSSDHWENV